MEICASHSILGGSALVASAFRSIYPPCGLLEIPQSASACGETPFAKTFDAKLTIAASGTAINHSESAINIEPQNAIEKTLGLIGSFYYKLSTIYRKLVINKTAIFSCSKCGSEKPSVDFHKNPSKRRGFESQCKSCVLKRKAKLRKSKVGRVRRIFFETSFIGSLNNFTISTFTETFVAGIQELIDAKRI